MRGGDITIVVCNPGHEAMDPEFGEVTKFVIVHFPVDLQMEIVFAGLFNCCDNLD